MNRSVVDRERDLGTEDMGLRVADERAVDREYDRRYHRVGIMSRADFVEQLYNPCSRRDYSRAWILDPLFLNHRLPDLTEMTTTTTTTICTFQLPRRSFQGVDYIVIPSNHLKSLFLKEFTGSPLSPTHSLRLFHRIIN